MTIGLLALALWAIGFIAWALARRVRTASGLPAGRVVSADTSRWLPAQRSLFSTTHNLTGRPDYLIRQGRRIIPVEVKTSPAPQSGPYESHMLQLAAYCLLLEQSENQRPPYGMIKYADQVFEVDYSPALERRLLQALDAMQRTLSGPPARRSHTDPARCAHCAYRHACDEPL